MVILANYVAKKVIFWPLSKLFWSCLGSVWALFSYLKGPLLGAIIPLNVINEPLSSLLGSCGCPSMRKIRRILILWVWCIRFFFGIFLPNLEKTNLKTVVGSFFPNLEKIEKYQKISKKTFLEILKTKLSNLEKSKS